MLGKTFLEGAARLGSGARGLASSVAGEIEHVVKARIETRLKKMNLISREEFEVVKALAEQARTKVEDLEKRLEEQQGKKQGKKQDKQQDKQQDKGTEKKESKNTTPKV